MVVWSSSIRASALVLCTRLLYCRTRVAKAGGHSTDKRTSTIPPRAGRTRRLVRVLFLFVAVLIVVDALVGDRGLLAMLDARRQHAELAAAIARQRAENTRLRDEARRFTSDPSAIEEIARCDLGLIRPGEKVFIVRDLPSPAKP